MRYETKFILPEYQYDEMRFRILSSSFLFSEIFHRRTVNNIYLDTAELHHFHENLAGASNRAKHRIRWYGDCSDTANPVLEHKIKQGEVGYKRFYCLPSFSPDDFDYNQYISDMKKRASADDHRNRILCGELAMEIPTLLNSYSRCYFLSHDGRYRITLDDCIEYRDATHGIKSSFSFTDNKVVMELKYESDHIGQANRVVQELGCRVSKNSKYVTGINGIFFNVFPQ